MLILNENLCAADILCLCWYPNSCWII